MQDYENHQNKAVGNLHEKKPYSPPELREYGNIAKLTQGTGLVLLDILVQGSVTVTATTLG